MHSGLQAGGVPLNPGRQEQAACPCKETVHLLFGPQGVGSHGDDGLIAGGPKKYFIYII